MWHPLGAADINTLGQRSQDQLHAHFANFASGATPPWLRQGHPYLNGQLPRGTAIAAVAAQDLIEMVAVSGPLHCCDGWSYLARALNALLSGDAHASRHLAYYAELRAALSILASDGVGIFDGRNFVIDANGGIHPLAVRGTHDIAWAALKDWANQPQSFERIATAIDVVGVSLLDGLQAFFPSSTGSSLGSALIEAWGYDLMAGVGDRTRRNYSSYVATDLDKITTIPSEDLEFVDQLWRSFEPGSWQLERFLLRHLLNLEVAATAASPLSARRPSYDQMDPRLQSAISFEFLAGAESAQEHPLLSRAADLTTPDPKAMLARSALLLRIATGMARANLLRAGVNGFNDLESWWSSVGLERGFWTTASEPTQMDELWLPIQEALDAAANVNTQDRSSMIGSMGDPVGLVQTDRVPLWALCA